MPISLRIKSYKRKADLLRLIRDLPAIISGRIPDRHSIRKVFFNWYGYSLLGKIHEAFQDKSEGGADELGERWKPLDPKTIAARPIRYGEKTKLGILKPRSGAYERGLLTPEQNRRWKGIFASTLARLLVRGVPKGEAKAQAAKLAWAILKSQGAKTKLQVLGTRKVKLLNVSGRLEASLTQGRISAGNYVKPREQLFTVQGRLFTIGSRVPYAIHVHKTRPLWPSVRKMRPWIRQATIDARDAIASQLASVG